MEAQAVVEGTCDPRFVAVREAFARNFTEHGETGAGVAVVVDGRTVVDLWGGHADADGSVPWRRDHLVNVYSVGKAFVAVAALMLVERGALDLDAPVARWWREFAAARKEEVTLRHLLSHTAGLPAVRRRLPDGAQYDWDVMASALAVQEPWWTPGTGHGYHVNTFGYLVGEVVRRVDGRRIGRFLREEVTGPLGADSHVGLDLAHQARVAEFVQPGAGEGGSRWPDDPAGLDEVRHMIRNAYVNPPGLSGAGVVNTPAWRAAEVPSANTHATARGVARVYEALVAGGALDGVRLLGAEVLAEATTEQAAGPDRVLERPSRFGLGLQLTQPERPLGPNPGAYGHFGAGGSLGFADPDGGVAFGYVTNQMGPRWQNPRNRGLIDAVYASL